MRTFTMYRRGDLSATHDANQVNPPDEPQFQGVVFDDGSVAIRWMTAKRSTSVWASLEDALAVHGHPEYDSELVWNDTRLHQALAGTLAYAEETAHAGEYPHDGLIEDCQFDPCKWLVAINGWAYL